MRTARHHRVLGLAFVLALLLVIAPRWARAGAPLREADVIALARTQAPTAAVAQATEGVADARSRHAGRLPNPSLNWSRETVETGPVADQDLAFATMPIDVARPLTTRSLTATEASWTRVEASLLRTQAVREALLVYYAVALAEQRIAVLQAATNNLDEAARVLARREAAGTASGYESSRLAIASELLRSEVAQAHGERQAGKTRLAGMLGIPAANLEVEASLELMAVDGKAVEQRPAKLEATRQAELAERHAARAQTRARWAWLPRLELNAGLKRVDEFNGRGVGYLVGVGLELPIFDRGQALRAEAKANRALIAARTDALGRALEAEAEAALVEFRAARAELERFEATTSTQVETLLAAARSGYVEGERSIVELLDAQRAQTEVAERRLTLLGAAKQAEIRFRAARGDLR